MTPEERALTLAMYRLELNDASVTMDLPPGVEVKTNLGELDWQAEKLIRAEWARWGRERQTSLLRAIGAEVLLQVAKEEGIIDE